MPGIRGRYSSATHLCPELLSGVLAGFLSHERRDVYIGVLAAVLRSRHERICVTFQGDLLYSESAPTRIALSVDGAD